MSKDKTITTTKKEPPKSRIEASKEANAEKKKQLDEEMTLDGPAKVARVLQSQGIPVGSLKLTDKQREKLEKLTTENGTVNPEARKLVPVILNERG